MTTALTVGWHLARAATVWSDREALIIGERCATYAQILSESRASARGLLGLGVRRGDRVGTLMHNCWDAIILHYAASLIGAVHVPLNTRYKADELKYAVGFADLVGVFTTPNGSEHADLRRLMKETFPVLAEWRYGHPLHVAEAPSLQFIGVLGDNDEQCWLTRRGFQQASASVSEAELDAAIATVHQDDICVMMFSSGTTARPKACMLSHRNIILTGEALAERFELTLQDRFWDPLPFFHMSTIMPLTACRSVGATFIGVEHFEPGAGLVEIEQRRATIIYPAFQTLMASLIAQPEFKSRDLSAVRLSLNVGAPDLLRRFASALPHAKQVSCYGLTEGGGVCCWNEPGDTLDQRVETAGRPVRGVEMRVVDPETLTDMPVGARGEILVRGFCVFSGYYKDEAQTKLTITPDGWLRTSDLGELDADGRVIFRGRLKDMLKIGGENVAAVEIESYLMRHPAVKLAQVISVPDERLVEVAAAFLELLPGANVTEQEIVEFCADSIASFKIPRHIRFVSAWPMSTTKIQKFKLAEEWVTGASLDVAAILRNRSAKEVPTRH